MPITYYPSNKLLRGYKNKLKRLYIKPRQINNLPGLYFLYTDRIIKVWSALPICLYYKGKRWFLVAIAIHTFKRSKSIDFPV